MPGRTDSVERKGSCAGRMAQTVTRIIPEMNVFMAKSIRRPIAAASVTIRMTHRREMNRPAHEGSDVSPAKGTQDAPSPSSTPPAHRRPAAAGLALRRRRRLAELARSEPRRHGARRRPAPLERHRARRLEGDRARDGGSRRRSSGAIGSSSRRPCRTGTPSPGALHGAPVRGACAYDRKTGKQLWEQVARVATPHEPHHSQYGSFASNSPITDGTHVIAFFGSRGLYAYTLDGKLVWQKDFGQLRMFIQFGEGRGRRSTATRCFVVRRSRRCVVSGRARQAQRAGVVANAAAGQHQLVGPVHHDAQRPQTDHRLGVARSVRLRSGNGRAASGRRAGSARTRYRRRSRPTVWYS